MKLEKREITLNESDSLKEALYLEKLLLGEYVETLFKTERKDVRAELLRLMQETGEDMCLLLDLWRKSMETSVK